MAYVVLARKWRPSTFDDVVGQQHVCRTLKRALELGRWSHAYLFSGPRGVGKTTVARILAKALNCDQGPAPVPCNECSSCKDIAASRGMDVLEIDGASHRGIDEIRTLRENVRYAPTKGKHKIYIIDEVHMLTAEAFNALLKTLEEPPPSVVFIFATTELHKVPTTIASRCQRFEFRKIAATEIRQRLRRISDDEGFRVSDEALGLVARRADGSMRDAEGLLDQVIAFAGGPVEPGHLEELLGETGEQSAQALMRSILSHDARGVLTLIDGLLQTGTDPGQLAQSFSRYLRDLVLVKVGAETDSLGTVPADQLKRLTDTASTVAEEDLVAMLTLWAPLQRQLRTSPNPRLSLELAALSLAKREQAATVRDVLERLRRAEELMVEEAVSGSVSIGPESAMTREVPPKAPRAVQVEEPPPRKPQPPPGESTAPSEHVSDVSEAPRAVKAQEPLPRKPQSPPGESTAPSEHGSDVSEAPRAIKAQEPPPRKPQPPAVDDTAPSQHPSDSSEMTTDELPPWNVDLWGSLIDELKDQNMSLGAFLVGTLLEEEGPDRYQISFPERHAWHMDQVQLAENMAAVVETIRRHTGGNAQVRCSVKQGLFVDEPDEAPVEAVEEVADPAVKNVIEVFDGDLLGYETSEGEKSDES